MDAEEGKFQNLKMVSIKDVEAFQNSLVISNMDFEITISGYSILHMKLPALELDREAKVDANSILYICTR
ncbi:MAG: hypothetical protein LBU32_18515 [Clostridiales bacterium]|nr:hypothetical protein [Clostridiales bacterium]